MIAAQVRFASLTAALLRRAEALAAQRSRRPASPPLRDGAQHWRSAAWLWPEFTTRPDQG